MNQVRDLSDEQVRTELSDFTEKHGYARPDRSTICPSRPWKNGVPNYDRADLAFFRGRTTVHTVGSLCSVVENAVKNWEMEATHLRFADWRSVDHANYAVSANGGKRFTGEEGALAGNYNWLMENVEDKSLYDAQSETFESSHSLFGSAFPNGFPWEVLTVFSGPPRIAFSWRHWASFDGVFKGREGDNETYEMYGFGTLDVTPDLKVKEIQIYYKPDGFLKALHGKMPLEQLKRGQSLVGSGCPVLNMQGANGQGAHHGQKDLNRHGHAANGAQKL